ncbi:MAG: class I SAM-dependent methyltransferase [Candidatus Bathyarchaeota archaeon]|nr:class I SAM-dependent methyltransferase [Candidatus Bathyarchaeota archaeon]
MNVFDAMGKYWAEIADANQTPRQISFLKTHLPSGGYVLDLACGTGRHMTPLMKAGFGLVGLDVSGKLLRLAKQRDKSVQVVCGDLRYLPFKKDTFGAAVSMDTSIGYLPSVKDDVGVLVEAHRVLKEGGVLAVDVFNKSHLTAKYKGKPAATKRLQYPNFTLEQTRTVSEDGVWLCDLWTVQGKTGEARTFEHRVRLYEQEALKMLLVAARFGSQQFFGNYDGQAFGADSPRLIVVAAAAK